MKTPWDYAATGNEFSHQVALFQWCNMAAMFGIQAANDPLSYNIEGHAKRCFEQYNDTVSDLRWLFAIKNAGHGDAVRGARSAAEGVKAGVPDVCLPVPVDLQASLGSVWFHGLYIELKRVAKETRKSGVISKSQIEWQTYLQLTGYRVQVCYGWEAARDCLLKYLGR